MLETIITKYVFSDQEQLWSRILHVWYKSEKQIALFGSLYSLSLIFRVLIPHQIDCLL